jgi:hypothetical protein
MHVNPLLTVYMWICFPGLTTLIFWVRMCRFRVKIVYIKFPHEYGAPECDSFDELFKMFHSPYLCCLFRRSSTNQLMYTSMVYFTLEVLTEGLNLWQKVSTYHNYGQCCVISLYRFHSCSKIEPVPTVPWFFWVRMCRFRVKI